MSIEHALLDGLALAAPHTVLPFALSWHVKERVIPVPSVTEITAVRERLEAAGYLVSIRDGATAKLRYAITDAGRAWLASNHDR